MTIPRVLILSLVALAGCATEPTNGTTEALRVDCGSGVSDFAPGTSYATGALVRYHGTVYRCIQAHTALDVWPPDQVPALWQPVECQGPTPSPTPSPSPNPTPTPQPTPSSTGAEYAPYFYTWGWGNPAYAFTSLVDLRAKSALGQVTLAFILSEGGCKASRDVQDHAADVAAFRAAGGRLKASFGGANGVYLESACADVASLATAIGAFVDETGITDLDFDVEQPAAMVGDVNTRRAAALAQVQAQKGIRVAFTLPSLPRDKWNTPGGLDANGQSVVKAAVAAGVKIAHVNLMTMDFGGYYSTGRAMGDLAASAASDAAAQLQTLAGVNAAQAFAMIGITPMIGVNDVASEVFGLDDAKSLVAFARANGVGLLAFWAINRDQACAAPNLALCSEVNTANFQFNQIFQGVLK